MSDNGTNVTAPLAFECYLVTGDRSSWLYNPHTMSLGDSSGAVLFLKQPPVDLLFIIPSTPNQCVV